LHPQPEEPKADRSILMTNDIRRCWLLVAAAAMWLVGWTGVAIGDEPDWQKVKTYQYGESLQPLLAVEREVYKSLASPDQRRQMAAQLVAIMADSQATPAARQFAAMELWTAGTEADVPALAKMLDDPVVADWAREALEMIPVEASGAALRAALGRLKGRTLIGVINSLGNRRDTQAVEALGKLARDADAEVVAAAVGALLRIGGERAVAEVVGLTIPVSRVPRTPNTIAAAELERRSVAFSTAFLRLAESWVKEGQTNRALETYCNAVGRQAIEEAVTMLSSDDPEARAIATGHLAGKTYREEELKPLIPRLGKLPPAGRALLLGVLAERGIKSIAPEAEAAVKAPELPLRLAGIRALALVGDAKHVALLASRLGAEEPAIDEAARDSLNRLSAPGVDEALLATLATADPPRRAMLIELLAWRKCAIAVPALLVEAARGEPEVCGAAILALRALATPKDIPALIKWIVAAKAGAQKDEMEKALVAISGQIANTEHRADAVMEVYAAAGSAERVALLPLLGRLGDPRALAAIREAMKSTQPETKEAAIRGLCNWPDASVAPELLELARQSGKSYSVWALRAYVRVITLPSSGRDLETLAMLKEAMRLAKEKDERQLKIGRAHV